VLSKCSNFLKDPIVWLKKQPLYWSVKCSQFILPNSRSHHSIYGVRRKAGLDLPPTHQFFLFKWDLSATSPAKNHSFQSFVSKRFCYNTIWTQGGGMRYLTSCAGCKWSSRIESLFAVHWQRSTSCITVLIPIFKNERLFCLQTCAESTFTTVRSPCSLPLFFWRRCFYRIWSEMWWNCRNFA